MSQQGERPTADDWWNRLYDESAPDTGPAAAAGDTLDDRFDSAADAVGTPDAEGAAAASGVPMGPESAPPAQRPRAWWEQPPPAEAPPVPPRQRAPWEPPGPYAPSDARPLPGSVPTPLPERQDPRQAPPKPEPAAPPSPTAPTSPMAATSPMEPPSPAAPTAPAVPSAPDVPPPGRSRHSPPRPTTTPRPGDTRPQPTAPPRSEGSPENAPATRPSPPDPRRHEPASSPARPAPPVREPGRHRSPGPPVPPVSPAAPGPWRAEPFSIPAPPISPSRATVSHLGAEPPPYDPEPTALPPAHADRLDEVVADTVLDGARYGTYSLRAVSVRGDSARYRGEPRRDALLTARFGQGAGALVLVAVASGAPAADGAHRAAADACHWIGGAVGRHHSRLSEDIRAGRRDDLKSGLHRLTDRGFGRLRARAAELGRQPEQYTASLRCLLLSADPECRNRVFFGVGGGGLFRLRDGTWEDLEPSVRPPGALTGEPLAGLGSQPAETVGGDRLTMDLGITTAHSPYGESPLPPPPEPFRFRASMARPGDTLLLCSTGLAEPMRGEAALAKELAERWGPMDPPGLAEYLADTQLRVKGYADDRTAVGVWEA
ncbi:protein phosphatase 2C domain-containing protein [Streptomyces sp. NPDC058200]|uniref:protein phosphatase 2C domain-containing protein n=1 Tax=Streptomyces sp. NPDC058200 TaxID=3346378 RepID=UPI0036E9DEA1